MQFVTSNPLNIILKYVYLKKEYDHKWLHGDVNSQMCRQDPIHFDWYLGSFQSDGQVDGNVYETRNL